MNHLHNPESIPSTAHLIIPSRLNAEEFTTLKASLGERKIVLVIEGEGTHTFLDQCADHQIIKFSSTLPELKPLLGADGVALFIPRQVSVLKGSPLDILPETLATLCTSDVPLSPLAVHRAPDTQLAINSTKDEPASQMRFGDSLTGPTQTPSNLLQNTLIAAEACFSSRDFLKGSLSASLFRALSQHGDTCYVHDGNDDQRLSYARLQAASLALSDLILKRTTNKRIGIILPPGKAGLIANLAVLFAGKVPVNLNFTAGKKAIESSIQQAGLDYYITASAFMEKVPTFPWPLESQLVLLDQVVQQLKPKALLWLAKLKLSSPNRIIKKRGLLESNNNDEAILLFTSGSSGEPKGVPLSHRNLLANICQFSSRLSCQQGSSLLACLPLFHSFGATVTTFFPILEGHNIVTYPSPLETKKLSQLIDEHRITFLTSTPTFLRGFLRHATKEQFAKLKFVITAAEKLPKNLAQTFENRLNHLPYEGYGLTETSPASYINLPNPDMQEDYPVLPSAKPCTVGLPLCGVAVRITDPTSGEELPLSASGCIWLKGANIFTGYLNKPDLSAEVLQDGWFNTGDIGHVDEDGFLTLDGRLSRFSKIAGEMVPHETVEAEISKLLELDGEIERKIAIVGIPDEKKGEALVLLSCIAEHQADGFMQTLKKQLIAADIPALWCPRTLVPTDSIPILASGKLDLAGCKAEVTASEKV